jgi:hypothetical protein
MSIDMPSGRFPTIGAETVGAVRTCRVPPVPTTAYVAAVARAANAVADSAHATAADRVILLIVRLRPSYLSLTLVFITSLL